MTALKVINEQMEILEIPYEFNEWTSEPIPKMYFVGEEYREDEIENEDGASTASMILTGFHRGKYIALEEAKEKIKQHFHPVDGWRSPTDSGVIAVFFNDAFSIPSGEANLTKIQITLKIKEWKGEL